MGTLNFTTGQTTVEGKIEYWYTRNTQGYTIGYEVFFKRKNSYAQTDGTIKYKVYINDSVVEENTNTNFVVTTDMQWCRLTSGQISRSLSSVYDTSSFTIGFSSERGNSQSPEAFNVSKTTSPNHQIVAYATRAGKSSAYIYYEDGSNAFTLWGTIGSNGTVVESSAYDDNNATGCRVYYTTDGSVPTTNSPFFTFYGSSGQNWEVSLILDGRDLQVRAMAHTQSKYGDAPLGDTTSVVYMYYYSPPSRPEGLKIDFNKSKPSKNAIYSFSWSPSTQGSNNPVKEYCVKITKQGRSSKNVEVITSATTVEYSGKELSLEKGDDLSFSVYAKGSSNFHNISPESFSGNLEIVSAGVAKIKINNIWTEGQVWIKKDGIWIEATEVFVKYDNKWNSST